MKVVYAATTEQQTKIKELTEYIYNRVFPYYFPIEKITQFMDERILLISEEDAVEVDTLKDAYQVISSLQTIISILESLSYRPLSEKYQVLFEMNVHTINDYGVHFPFTFTDFSKKGGSHFTPSYVPIENEYLM